MKTRPIKLYNPLNKEVWYCDDYAKLHSIDGVDYVRVYKPDLPNRSHLMRKDALHKSVTSLTR